MAAALITRLLVPAPGAGVAYNLVINSLRGFALAATAPLFEQFETQRELTTRTRLDQEAIRVIRLRQGRVAEQRRLAEEREARVATQLEARDERIGAQIEERELERQRFVREQALDRFAEGARLQAERLQAQQDRDEAIRADINRREEERAATFEASRLRDLTFRAAVEQRRAAETAARLAINAARLELQRERDERITAQIEEREARIAATALPLAAETLIDEPQLVRAVRNSGTAWIRVQDAAAQGIISAWSWSPSIDNHSTITTPDGRVWRVPASHSQPLTQRILVGARELADAGLITPTLAARIGTTGFLGAAVQQIGAAFP